MNPNEVGTGQNDWNRREFLRGASFGTLMMLMGGVPLEAQTNTPAGEPATTSYHTYGPPVSIGLIGCGVWGKEILLTLATLPNAPVVAICDNYAAAMRKVKDAAPKATPYDDYKKLLADKAVQAVIVATPTHLHREIVEAALAAGKHVYCEVPLAANSEESLAIARAAKAAVKLNFQSGLQVRSDKQKHWLVAFIRGGAVGKTIQARSQWHKKTSWRRPAASPEREAALNWRLSSKTSPGLLGEIGIHQLDLMRWYLNARPTAVSGFGGIVNYSDGRDVADTTQSIVEFPNGVNLSYDISLASSFDSDYDMIYGTDSTVMMRGNKAWMFKENDAPVVGWEVYARKDLFYNETGIALVADASKQKAMLNKATATDANFTDSALHYALVSFVENSHLTTTTVADHLDSGFDLSDLPAALAKVAPSRRPAAGYVEGYEATVLALKANEAVIKGRKIELTKDLFTI